MWQLSELVPVLGGHRCLLGINLRDAVASPAPTHSRSLERARPLGVPLIPTGGRSWLRPLCKRLEKLQVSADGVVGG